MCAVVELCGHLVVINLKGNEVIGTDAELNGSGDVANTGRDDEFDRREKFAVCVVYLHPSG